MQHFGFCAEKKKGTDDMSTLKRYLVYAEIHAPNGFVCGTVNIQIVHSPENAEKLVESLGISYEKHTLSDTLILVLEAFQSYSAGRNLVVFKKELIK